MKLGNWSHFYQEKKSHWVQMSLYYQVKPRWVSGSLKGEIGCQRFLTGVWAWLCGYVFSSHENDIYADHSVIGNDLPLATSSVEHQECISQSYSWWECLHGVTTRLCCLGGVRRKFGCWRSHSTIWNSLESLIWTFCINDSKFGLCRAEKITLCFGRYNMGNDHASTS